MPPIASTARIAFLRAAGAAVVASLFGGCGGQARTPAPPPAQSRLAEPAATASPVAAEHEPAEIKATIDASGRKWLTPTIPYDLFADVPSDEEAASAADSDDPPARVASVDRAATSGPSASRQPGTTPGLEASDAVAPRPVPGSAPGDLLPIETLQQEIAAVRNRLGENLLTVGSYNAAFEDVANDAWEMSALATIAAEHPGSISWKAAALLARDASVAIATAATARGRRNFTEAQAAREQLAAILNSNTPAGLPTPDPDASREETADRPALMARVQSAFDLLKAASADEATFRKDALRAEHEARMLAALGRFVAHSDYSAADEADYRSAADALIEGSAAVATAAAGQDFAALRSALDRVGNACNDCHKKYRFEN